METRATVGKNLGYIWLQFPPLCCFLMRVGHYVDNGIDRTAYGDPEACFSTFVWWEVKSVRQYHRAATGLNLKAWGKAFGGVHYLFIFEIKLDMAAAYYFYMWSLLANSSLFFPNLRSTHTSKYTAAEIMGEDGTSDSALSKIKPLFLIESFIPPCGQEKQVLYWH